MLVLTRLSKYLDCPSHCIDYYYNTNNEYIGYVNKNIDICTDRFIIKIKIGKKAYPVKLLIREVVNSTPTVIITYTLENGTRYEYFARLWDREAYLRDISHARIEYRDKTKATVKISMKNNIVENYTRSLNNTTTYLLYKEDQIVYIEVIKFDNGNFTISKYNKIV